MLAGEKVKPLPILSEAKNIYTGVNMTKEQEVREILARLEFCINACGENIAPVCKNKDTCRAYGREQYDYGRARAVLRYLDFLGVLNIQE